MSKRAANRLGWPLFVKPCASGSSLGASRANDAHELNVAIEEALQFGTRVLLECYVDSREIECAVTGNAVPQAHVPGEVVPSDSHGFYNYDAKYTDPDGAKLISAANLDSATRKVIMRTAEAAYAAVHCEGMARIDFFLERSTGALFLNEINTIPGFTNISMFPRMCEASGLAYPALLDKLVSLALQRDADNKSMRFQP